MVEFSTFVEILRYRARHQPEGEAYTFLLDGENKTQSITYGELDWQAQMIAAQLQSLDLAGQRALLLYPPGLEFIAAFVGCLYAKVIAVPAYPPRKQAQFPKLLVIAADARAAAALTTPSLMASLKPQFAQYPDMAALHWLTATQAITGGVSNWQEPAIGGDDLALLQYTSGTTGTPKGAAITHSNLLHNSAALHQCLESTPNSRGVSWLPLYHDMGLIGGVLHPLYVGAPMVLMSPITFFLKPVSWLQAISRYQATISGGPNAAYDLACRRITDQQRTCLDLSSWEVAFNGSEPIRASTLERFAATFAPCGFRREAFYPCYGLAEATLIVAGGVKAAPPVTRQVDGEALKQNRVVAAKKTAKNALTLVGFGRRQPEQTIRIVDPDSLTLCPPEQVGEVWVSGPSVAQGYWKQPLPTQETFRAYIAGTGEEPFLRTGDLGFMQDGELFITGRLKDLIIIMGRNHYPENIELTVEQSHPALRPNSGAAFSVEVAGQEKLIVAQEVEWNYSRTLDTQEVIESIRRTVIEQHDLQAYAILLLKPATLPKTSSGKVQRSTCRDRFLAGSLRVLADWSLNPRNKIKFLHLEKAVESLLQQLQASNNVSSEFGIR